LVCAVVALLSMVSCASASAALNLTGTWSANYHCETGACAGSNSPATDTLTQAEGSEVVTGSNAGETITGTLTGNTFVFESSVGAYKAKATLTVAANGLSWSGPLEDSNHTTGTYTATRELTSGALSQLGEPSDCIGEAKEEVAKCGTSVPYGLSYAYQVQVSPDARNAYSVAVNGDLIEYSRNLANGSLTVIGCFSSLAKSEPACAREHAEMEVAAVGQPAAIAISPDGASAYVISQLNNTVAEFSRNPETGLLTKIGCITEESTLSECATVGAKGLFTPYGITVSPDGENVYVASFNDESVAEFKRDTETGVLTQLGAPNNCISEKAGSGCGTTTGVIGLKEAIGVAVSPDGKDVYVAAGAKSEEGGIAAFARGAEGALEQLHGEEACIGEKVTGCAKGEHIRGSEDLAISPDGKNLYANSYPGGASAVIELDRNETTGALEQLASPNECVSTETLSGCTKAEGVGGPLGVAISPDGENVYATSANENAVAAFKRGAEGALEQLSQNPCVTENTSGCGSPEFNQRVGLKFARRLTVSPDGTSVYVAGQEDHAIVELARTVNPKVTTISPSTGSEAGSTEVTIHGTGFAEGANVEFESKPALNVTVDSASEITATSPAGSGSKLHVTVTNPAGTSPAEATDEFTYTTPGQPTIGEIAPTYGNELGETKVTIIGTEFLAGSEVHFGSSPATNVTVDSGKEITATSPAGALGVVNVTVTTSDGTSAFTPGDEYKYVYVPPKELGGMNIAGYCERIGDDGNGGSAAAYLKGGVNGPEYAYNNWACVEDDGHDVEIATTGPAPSMENLCTLQYSVAAYGYASEPNTAFSWNCYEGAPPPAKGGGGGGSGSGGTVPTAKVASLVTPIVSVPPLILPPPVLAKTGNVAPVSGAVLVKVPGTSKFVPLSSLQQVPFGSVIEATNGTVSVTTALPGGKTQTGQFFSGEFILRQGANGVVVAELTGGNFSVCPTKRERSHIAHAGIVLAQAAASGGHVVRKLWANAHGKFSTKGNYAAGAVQGTEWLTEDLCDGTLIKVTRDKVAVTNLVTHHHVEVTTGHHYLAKAP
jgi:DNA-binding beta-propeller fold protein YncE